MKNWHTRYLWRNPKRRSGAICVRGTRIALTDIFGIMGLNNVRREYPDLTDQQIEAATDIIGDILEQYQGGPIR